ncbi:hypothetical protein JTE90_017018 [Oedothorax gibbosus]|uniref:Uncharacterized protein n=1 Tax=Oedothorax gibbosus TaxID=931172 RepID=A0AAV6UC91_9ARAC|nr:hypothetical protein JTE90_017018 [Oedothorax gibbosus]
MDYKVPVNSKNFHTIFNTDANEDTFELLYTALEYCINSFNGTAGPKNCSLNDLRQYLDKIIPLNSEIKERCLKKAALMKAPKLELDLYIRRNKNSRFLAGELFSKCHFKDKKAKICCSRPTVANLEWPKRLKGSTHLIMQLKTSDKNVIYVDIYRNTENRTLDADQKEVGRGDSSHGNANTYASIKTAELKGRYKLKVSKMHSDGLDKWVPIRYPNTRTYEGHVHAIAKFQVKSSPCKLDAVARHLLIIKLSVEKHRQNTTAKITNWESISTPESLSLINMHSVVANIPAYEDNLCRFIVVNHLALEEAEISFQFRYTLLKNCVESLKTRKQPLKVNSKTEISLTNLYKRHYEALKTDCLSFMQNLHAQDIDGNKNKRIDFEHALRAISLSESVTGLKCDPTDCLNSEAEKWYESTRKIISASEDKKKCLIDILEQERVFLTAADRVLKKVHPEISYTNIIYQHIDIFINEVLKKHAEDLAIDYLKSLENIEERMSSDIQLFETSKRLIKYIYKSAFVFKSQYSEMRKWFGLRVIERWFYCKQSTAIEQIRMALRLDRAVNRNPILSDMMTSQKISSSCNVITTILQNNLVKLKDLVESYEAENLFINSLQECILVIADEYKTSCSIKINPKTIDAAGSSFETRKNADIAGSSCEESKDSDRAEKPPEEIPKPHEEIKNGGITVSSRKTETKVMSVLANNLNVLSTFVEETVSGTAGVHSPKSAECLSECCWSHCSQIAEMYKSEMAEHVKKISQSTNKISRYFKVKNFVKYMKKLVFRKARPHMVIDVFLHFVSDIWDYALAIIDETAFSCSEETEKGEKKYKNVSFKGLLQALNELTKKFSKEDIRLTLLGSDRTKKLETKLQEASKKCK